VNGDSKGLPRTRFFRLLRWVALAPKVAGAKLNDVRRVHRSNLSSWDRIPFSGTILGYTQ